MPLTASMISASTRAPFGTKNSATPPTMVKMPQYWNIVFLPRRLIMAGTSGVMISAMPTFIRVMVAVWPTSPMTYLA